MAPQSEMEEPGPWARLVRGVSRVTGRAAMAANIVGTLMVLALVVVINYDVVVRDPFNKPFHGAVEIVQFTMVLIVFLQLPDVVRVDRLTRSDGLLVILDGRYPRLTVALRRIIDAVSAVFMALIAVTIWPEFTEMWRTQDYFGVPGVFTAPWWPIKLVIFAGGALCALIFVLKILSPGSRTQLIRAPEHEDRA